MSRTRVREAAASRSLVTLTESIPRQSALPRDIYSQDARQPSFCAPLAPVARPLCLSDLTSAFRSRETNVRPSRREWAARLPLGILLATSAIVIVVREGGEYLERRERRLWWRLVLGFITGVGFAIAAVTQLHYALLAVPPAMVLAALAVPHLKRVRKGRLGERLVTNLLKRLPDDYYLVNDVMLPGAGGNIDHVVLGPCGIVVIETKRVAGKIFCSGDKWYVNGFHRRSISRQVNRAAVALRQFLGRHHPDVNPGFIESITVFTHPLCKLEVNRPRAIVVRYSELLQLMIDLGRRRRMRRETAENLATSLANFQASVTSVLSDGRVHSTVLPVRVIDGRE
jgi:hypothetical protein